jgi:preprotein translocase subunit SecY
LLYASNIQVILMAAVLANVSMFALLFWTNPTLQQVPLLGNNSWLGYFTPESGSSPAGGLAWYLSTPRGLADWLLPMLNPEAYASTVYNHSSLQILAKVVVYSSVMILGSIMFAKFWIMTTNMARRPWHDR